MIVSWTERALDDLEDLRSYIAYERPAAAAQLVERIIKAADLLSQFPLLGRSGEQPDTRELVVSSTPYVAIYRVDRDGIEILRVLHAAQLRPTED